MTDLASVLDAAYCRVRHAGEHLGRPEGCGSWTAKGMAEDPELRAALGSLDTDSLALAILAARSTTPEWKGNARALEPTRWDRIMAKRVAIVYARLR